MKFKVISPAVLAQSAYKAHNEFEHKHYGQLIVDWDDLPAITKQAWIAAVSAAMETFIENQ